MGSASDRASIVFGLHKPPSNMLGVDMLRVHSLERNTKVALFHCQLPQSPRKPCLIGWPTQIHAEEAETVVKALITSGGLNTVELCKNAAEAGEGLQRDFSQDDALLSPAEALLW